MDTLEKYRKMHQDILKRYEEALKTIETLKAEGKTKTITFREKLGEKGFYSRVLSMYDAYGIEDQVLIGWYRLEIICCTMLHLFLF